MEKQADRQTEVKILPSLQPSAWVMLYNYASEINVQKALHCVAVRLHEMDNACPL